MKYPRFLFAAPVLAVLFSLRLAAAEKGGMPDLIQIENTCLPTSTANVIIWLGKHGYPKLIQPGESPEEREDHTVHRLMAATGARYDFGTAMESITGGIGKYIHEAGYDADVEYRGIDGKASAFNQDWLKENDDPNRGFVLLLRYCRYNRTCDTFTNAWNAGHAVTLVNAESDMILIHDPAHDVSETGRKILTPELLTHGNFYEEGSNTPVGGLLLLSGSLLGAPPDAGVMLTGAVCITMHAPDSNTPGSGGAHTVLAGNGSSVGSGSAGAGGTTSTASSGWWAWLFDCCFGK